jgi:hypothetical protein
MKFSWNEEQKKTSGSSPPIINISTDNPKNPIFVRKSKTSRLPQNNGI